MTDEDTTLDEAQDNLKEAAQRVRAIQHVLRAAGLADYPAYRELSYRLSAALATTEAASVEVSCREERGTGP